LLVVNSASALQHSQCTTVPAVLPHFRYHDFFNYLEIPSLFLQSPTLWSFCSLWYSFSGLWDSLHPCTSYSLDFIVSIFHTPSYRCLWNTFCNTYSTIKLLLFLLLSKPFFVLPLYFWTYFGLGDLDCEWIVHFELPCCSNLLQP
jgi:hypothetical protein